MARRSLSPAQKAYLRQLLAHPDQNQFTDLSIFINHKFRTSFNMYDIDREVSSIIDEIRQLQPNRFHFRDEARHHLHHLYYVLRLKDLPSLCQSVNQTFGSNFLEPDVGREVKVLTDYVHAHPQDYYTRKQYHEKAVAEEERIYTTPNGSYGQVFELPKHPMESARDRELSRINGTWDLPYMEIEFINLASEKRLLSTTHEVDEQHRTSKDGSRYSQQSLAYVTYAAKFDPKPPVISTTSAEAWAASSQPSNPTSSKHQPASITHILGPGNNIITSQTTVPRPVFCSSVTAPTDGRKRKTSSATQSVTSRSSTSQSSADKPSVEQQSKRRKYAQQTQRVDPHIGTMKESQFSMSHQASVAPRTMKSTPTMVGQQKLQAFVPQSVPQHMNNQRQGASSLMFGNQKQGGLSLMTNMQTIQMERYHTYPGSSSTSSLPQSKVTQRNGVSPQTMSTLQTISMQRSSTHPGQNFASPRPYQSMQGSGAAASHIGVTQTYQKSHNNVEGIGALHVPLSGQIIDISSSSEPLQSSGNQASRFDSFVQVSPVRRSASNQGHHVDNSQFLDYEKISASGFPTTPNSAESFVGLCPPTMMAGSINGADRSGGTPQLGMSGSNNGSNDYTPVFGLQNQTPSSLQQGTDRPNRQFSRTTSHNPGFDSSQPKVSRSNNNAGTVSPNYDQLVQTQAFYDQMMRQSQQQTPRPMSRGPVGHSPMGGSPMIGAPMSQAALNNQQTSSLGDFNAYRSYGPRPQHQQAGSRHFQEQSATNTMQATHGYFMAEHNASALIPQSQVRSRRTAPASIRQAAWSPSPQMQQEAMFTPGVYFTYPQ